MRDNGNFIGDFQRMVEKLFTIHAKILSEREKENNDKIKRYEGVFMNFQFQISKIIFI